MSRHDPSTEELAIRHDARAMFEELIDTALSLTLHRARAAEERRITDAGGGDREPERWAADEQYLVFLERHLASSIVRVAAPLEHDDPVWARER